MEAVRGRAGLRFAAGWRSSAVATWLFGAQPLDEGAMKPLLTGLMLISAAPLAAHPHIFIDVGLKAIVDDQGA